MYYVDGETVQLTAHANSGYQFIEWDGALSGSINPQILVMNGDKSVIAFFNSETISTPNTPTGSSSGKVGQSLTFSTGGSASNLGHTVEYQFDWGDGTQSGWGSATQSHSYSSSGTKYVKARSRCQTHTSVVSSWSNTKSVSITYCTLSININPSGSGSVSKSPDKTNYTYNETVQLTAHANSGYQFTNWSGNLGGSSSPTTLVMNGDKSVTANFSVDSDVEEDKKIPTEFSLTQNYPNPFNPETVISYSTPKSAQVRIEIYNAIGKKIRTLVDSYIHAGNHQVLWDGRNDNGIQVSTGIYYYIMQSGCFRSMKKAVFMK